MCGLKNKSVPLADLIIRIKALAYYKIVHEEVRQSEHESIFSSGWFNRFSVCSELLNIKFSGESASADHAATEKVLAELADIIY